MVSDLLTNHIKQSEINRQTVLINSVYGYKFKLVFDTKDLLVNKPALGTIIITDSNNKPVTNLAPVMGAFAHIVAFHDDVNTIEHVHPMGAEPTKNTDRGGPELKFHINPEKKGFIKIFVQVNIEGKEIFVPFGVTIR